MRTYHVSALPLNGTVTSGSHVDTNFYVVDLGRQRTRMAKARGLLRRLRIPFVRQTIWERDNPQTGNQPNSYGSPWISDSALADFSFACTCHKRERYDRRKGR